jgi:putative transposase
LKKTYKFRAYINQTTEKQTNLVLELCRQIYNLCLEQRIDSYKNLRRSVSGYDQSNQLHELKQAYPEFKQIPSQTLQDVIERLDKAYKSFFSRVKKGQTAGFPRFKGFDRYDSLTLKQAGWKLNGSVLNIPKLGIFKLKLHRQIPLSAKIKTVTIRRSCNKWYVCFSCDNIIPKVLKPVNKSIGIDVGCESFLTDSNGLKIENPRWLNKSTERITTLQQKLSKQIKGSGKRKKTKLLLSKTHKKVSNQRLDFHHKVAKHYVDNYGLICHEKMNAFTSFTGLNRSMRDVAWFQFFNILNAKAEEAGRTIVKVPAKNTSQQCSQCLEIVSKTLDVRVHTCPLCKCSLDRDFNSALNILRLGSSRRDKPTPIRSSFEATLLL